MSLKEYICKILSPPFAICQVLQVWTLIFPKTELRIELQILSFRTHSGPTPGKKICLGVIQE